MAVGGGGDKSLLLRGAQLAEAERWLARSLAAQLVADFRALSDEELPARAIYDMLFLTVDQRVRDSD